VLTFHSASLAATRSKCRSSPPVGLSAAGITPPGAGRAVSLLGTIVEEAGPWRAGTMVGQLHQRRFANRDAAAA
jgi:hypothetical protein